MNIKLIKKLSEIGIIRQNTEIEAYYKGIDLSGSPLTRAKGTFYIQSVSINKDSSSATFGVLSTVDGRRGVVNSENIITLDGMPIERLASIYGINEEGGLIAQGKRRGRRPRAKVLVTA